MGSTFSAIAALGGLLFLAGPAVAQNQPVRVQPGYATVLKFDKAFGTVVIGDPRVADVLPRGDRAVLLSGRAIGTTNLIVLDSDNNQLLSTTVIVRVSPPPEGEIIVHRPTTGLNAAPTLHDYTSYNCAPECALVGHVLTPRSVPQPHQRNLEQPKEKEEEQPQQTPPAAPRPPGATEQ